MKNFVLCLFVIFLIGWQFNIALVSDSDAMLRGVASSGSSGGSGTVPSATCANNGGAIYGSAGAFTCNSSFTTDGAGSVSASTSVTSPIFAATGQMLFEGQGASTAGATVANNLWTFGGTITMTGTPSVITTGQQLNVGSSAGNVHLISQGTDLITLLPTGIVSTVAGTATIGSSGQPVGAINSTGAVSVGSLVANTNGIGAAVGQVGYVTSGAVLTAAAVTLSTGTVTSGANVGVPAGDFDITVTGCFTPSGTTTLNLITLGINNSNAQPAVDLGGFTQYNQAATSVPTANDICMQTTRRVLTTSATNYYAIATAVFATSTLKFHSYISARQMR